MAILLLSLIAVAALLAPLLAPHDPVVQDVTNQFAPASLEHPLSTDYLGRDVLSRLIHAARISLVISLGAVGVALVLAVPLGLLAGYAGGVVDSAVMRCADAAQSIPPLILALAIVGSLGPSLRNTVIALAIVAAPGLLRVVRAQTLTVRNETYVDASRTIGTRTPWIVILRVLPNIRSGVVVQISLLLGGALISESSLSFLGLGTQPPTASWGNMLRDAYDRALFTHPWQLLVPGAAIAVTVIAFNTLGDALIDVYGNDRRRGRRSDRLGITSVRQAQSTVVVDPSKVSLLEIRGLSVDFLTEDRHHRVIQDVNLTLERGQVLGLVGESGSGKSVTALSILRLLPPTAAITGGSVRFEGRDLLQLSFGGLRHIRGADIGVVFQDPMTCLDPMFTVGSHLAESLKVHSRPSSRARLLELLDMVGVSQAERRLGQYPHELSGGIRQRVMIAMALSCEPALLIADEPTTALDATVQAEILRLLRSLQAELGMAVLFVSHDLHVVADFSDQVAVMYAGEIIEEASSAEIFQRPRHPYTKALLDLQPQHAPPRSHLPTIPGSVPDLDTLLDGCRFAPRCEFQVPSCATQDQLLLPANAKHLVRCSEHEGLHLEVKP